MIRMEFNTLTVNSVSKVVFTMALLSPTMVNSVGHGHPVISQYVVYEGKGKIIPKNNFKKISFQNKISITNILPNSEDFTEEEEKIYSEVSKHILRRQL